MHLDQGSYMSRLGIKPTIQVCSLIRSQTCNPLVKWQWPNQLSHTSQGWQQPHLYCFPLLCPIWMGNMSFVSHSFQEIATLYVNSQIYGHKVFCNIPLPLILCECCWDVLIFTSLLAVSVFIFFIVLHPLGTSQSEVFPLGQCDLVTPILWDGVNITMNTLHF